MSSVPPVADSRPSISVSSVDRSLVLASCPPEAAPLCSVRPPACPPFLPQPSTEHQSKHGTEVG